MGYTTEFEGQIKICPPLNEQEINYLNAFNDTRRMNRRNGPYYVHGGGFKGQDFEEDVIDGNEPFPGQPGLWCQWKPTDDGTAIEWDGGEKFYESIRWMQYLIDHFIGSDPIAKDNLPFLQGHKLIGKIKAQGEESSDKWTLLVSGDFVFGYTKTFRDSINQIEKNIIDGFSRNRIISDSNLAQIDQIENPHIANLIYNFANADEIKTFLIMKFKDDIIQKHNKRDTTEPHWSGKTKEPRVAFSV